MCVNAAIEVPAVRKRFGSVLALDGMSFAVRPGDRVHWVSGHLLSELEDTADHLVIVGRGKVIPGTDTARLLVRVSSGRVMARSAAAPRAASVLARAGAAVTPSGPQALTASGLPAERVMAVLSGSGMAFSEVAGHRTSLEEAYLELTRGAVEYRAAATGEVV